jgi:GAF domain-containing protein
MTRMQDRSEPLVAARLRRLAALGDGLSAARSEDEVMQIVVDGGAQELEADTVAVCLLSDDARTYRIGAAAGLRATLHEAFETFPADAHLPVVDAVRDRTVVVVSGADDREARYPAFGVGDTTSDTIITAPMIVHAEIVIGALAIGLADRRSLAEADLAFIEAAAQLCGQAVHRARLYSEQVELVANLQIALSNHTAVEQAKGVMVVQLSVTPDEAFDRMRRHARANRTRIADVADAIVAGELRLD